MWCRISSINSSNMWIAPMPFAWAIWTPIPLSRKATWLSRGWCRAEWWCHLLSNKNDPSRLDALGSLSLGCLGGFQGTFCWKSVLVNFAHFRWQILVDPEVSSSSIQPRTLGSIRGLDGPGITDPSHLRSSEKRSVETCVFVLHGNTVIFTIDHVSWQEARGFFWFQILHLSKQYDKIAPCWEPCSTRWGICHWIILWIYDLYIFMFATFNLHERPLTRLITVPALRRLSSCFHWIGSNTRYPRAISQCLGVWCEMSWLWLWSPWTVSNPNHLRVQNFPFQPYAVDGWNPAPHGMYKNDSYTMR